MSAKRGEGRVQQHNRVARTLEMEQRRKRVAANILAGLTYREIADALGVSHGTVANDFRAIIREWRRHYSHDIDAWAQVHLRRLDVMLNSLWDRVKEGDQGAISTALKVMERQAKMLGFDAERDDKDKEQGHKTNVGVNVDLGHLSVEELLQVVNAIESRSEEGGEV